GAHQQLGRQAANRRRGEDLGEDGGRDLAAAAAAVAELGKAKFGRCVHMRRILRVNRREKALAAGPEALSGFDAVIDARTPAEFAEDHIPGAISAPVLDDAQRAEVGTLYKQISPFEAKKVGGALVARNIATHVERLFKDKPKDWKPLVYCWRGGKRSGAMAHVLREIGWAAHTLEGGYKAYRRWVVEELARLPGGLEFIVIHGATGSGKS